MVDDDDDDDDDDDGNIMMIKISFSHHVKAENRLSYMSIKYTC